jgi:hypothetical protein
MTDPTIDGRGWLARALPATPDAPLDFEAAHNGAPTAGRSPQERRSSGSRPSQVPSPVCWPRQRMPASTRRPRLDDDLPRKRLERQDPGSTPAWRRTSLVPTCALK